MISPFPHQIVAILEVDGILYLCVGVGVYVFNQTDGKIIQEERCKW